MCCRNDCKEGCTDLGSNSNCVLKKTNPKLIKGKAQVVTKAKFLICYLTWCAN